MKKLFAVIGDPIAHSMSPVMHNDLFRYYEIDAHYHPFLVKREALEAAINGFRAIGISGFNVTVPHKTAIIPFLDRLDPLAEAIGAVNTVVNEAGELVGYNTDGSGYVRGLNAHFPLQNHHSVLIVGAGGAARGIYFAMAQFGVKRIDIVNRTKERAEELVSQCPFQVESNVLTVQEAERTLEKYDLIIQTTSIGMTPNMNEIPLSLAFLKDRAFVSDIIYNPLETKWLQEARKRNAKTQNGLEMFLYQGALAFEKWTGIFPDIERMRENVLRQLGGKSC